MAPQILEQTKGKLTVFAAGLGTTGTLIGASRCLRRERPKVKGTEIAAELPGMTLVEAVRTKLFCIFGLCAAAVFYPIFATTQQFILYLQSPKIGLSL